MNTSSPTESLLSSRFRISTWKAPLPLTEDQRKWTQVVREKLETKELEVTPQKCPCHHSDKSKKDIKISEIDRYGLPLNTVYCSACGTLRIDPYLTNDSLSTFYRLYYQQMYGRTVQLDGLFANQRVYGKKILDIYKSTLPDAATILEIGCGTGGALKVFSESGFNVAGCDYSEKLISYGRQFEGLNKIQNSSIDEFLDNFQGKADLIYLHHVFEHLNNLDTALEALKKALNPSGRVLIIVPNVYEISEYAYPAGDLLLYLHIAHKYNFSSQCLKILGRRSGLDFQLFKIHSKAPEYWGEFSTSDLQTKQGIENQKVENLDYFIKTEKLFSLGLTKGQIKKGLNDLFLFPRAVAKKSMDLFNRL
ncbi:MAG: class I SAM-dependent methyltransferase [Bacteriovoracia bacterium]